MKKRIVIISYFYSRFLGKTGISHSLTEYCTRKYI